MVRSSQFGSIGGTARGFTLLEAVVVIFIIAILAGVVITYISGAVDRSPRDTTIASMIELRNSIVSRYYSDVGDLPQSTADLLRCRDNATYGLPPAIADLGGGKTSSAPGWKGPYLLHSGANYVLDNSRNFLAEYGPSMGGPPPLQPTINDAWGNPIIIQIPNSILEMYAPGLYRLRGVESPPASGMFPLENRYARLISAGPDGIIQTPKDNAGSTLPSPALVPPPPPAAYPHKDLCGDDIVLYLRVADLRLGGP